MISIHQARPIRSLNDTATRHFIHCGRRTDTCRTIAISHPHLPHRLRHHTFPLYHPYSVDAVIFWQIPSQKRAGHVLVTGLNVGAGHAALKEVLEDAEGAKVKRDMYAETQREKADIIESIRVSEWNTEMNPIVVSSQDNVSTSHDFSRGSGGRLNL